MRGIMPALQKAAPAGLGAGSLAFDKIELPQQRRDTRIEKNASPEQIAKEIVEWIRS
jgi:electron transfer flavoprotein beta subunit